MKRFFSLVGIVSTLLLFGCTTSTPLQEDMPVTTSETYENKIENFSLSFPTTWTFQENVFSSAVVFSTPLGQNDALKENVGIVVKALDKPYTLEEYQQVLEPQLQNSMTNLSKISDEQIEINGIAAKRLIYQGEQSSILLQRQQVYIIHNDKVYIITYTASADTFDEFIKEVNGIISSLVIK